YLKAQCFHGHPPLLNRKWRTTQKGSGVFFEPECLEKTPDPFFSFLFSSPLSSKDETRHTLTDPSDPPVTSILLSGLNAKHLIVGACAKNVHRHRFVSRSQIFISPNFLSMSPPAEVSHNPFGAYATISTTPACPVRFPSSLRVSALRMRTLPPLNIPTAISFPSGENAKHPMKSSSDTAVCSVFPEWLSISVSEACDKTASTP